MSTDQTSTPASMRPAGHEQPPNEAVDDRSGEASASASSAPSGTRPAAEVPRPARQTEHQTFHPPLIPPSLLAPIPPRLLTQKTCRTCRTLENRLTDACRTVPNKTGRTPLSMPRTGSLPRMAHLNPLGRRPRLGS